MRPYSKTQEGKQEEKGERGGGEENSEWHCEKKMHINML